MSSDKWLPAESRFHAGVDGLTIDDVHESTLPIAARHHNPDRKEEPLTTPIYHSSTYIIPSVNHYLDILNKGGYIYSRLGNPTCQAVEATFRAMEGGAGTLVYPSGMSAVTNALLAFLKAGDHVVACNPVYSGTHEFLSKYIAQYNMEVSWVTGDPTVEDYKRLMKPNTKILYAETPCNPLMSTMDLEGLAKLAEGREGVVTMVDSTFAPPPIQRPIKCGIDVVIHSGTKYLGGHSDVIAGIATTRTVDQWQKLFQWRTVSGSVLSPFDASLLLRGIRTIDVRLERHCSNAQQLAQFLEAHPKVDVVHYPGLVSHPGHLVAKKQMKAFGGMIAFEMKGGLESARAVVENVRLIQLAVSLGGVDSLMEHPATMTHGPAIMTPEERRHGRIGDGLIRFSVGLENVEDLKKDLARALNKA